MEQPTGRGGLRPGGNLYGTTLFGGASNCKEGCGVVFKLTPRREVQAHYTFCMQTNCTDGAEPSAGLVFDQRGNLYGTTLSGGADGEGTVFKLTPKGKETVLYSFCAPRGSGCADGKWPSAGVVLDQKGNLYGTTVEGGQRDCPYSGDVASFSSLLRKARRQSSTPSVRRPTAPMDLAPRGGLIFDQKENLYGTTSSGGAYNCTQAPYVCGVVFKLTPKGKETVLHSFCAQTNCADGEHCPLRG